MENRISPIDRQTHARQPRRAPRSRHLEVEFHLDALAPPGSAEVGLLLAAFPNLLGELVEALGDAAKD